MRGVRHVAESGGRAGEGEGDGRLLARGFREEAREAARGLAHGPGGGRGQDHRRSAAASRERRHPDRRRQLLLRRRHPPRQGARAEGHPLRRRRDQRRRLGAGARLLHDDRRRAAGGEAPGSDLRHAGPGHRRYPAHPGTREGRRHRRSKAICTAGRTAPVISSRWSTTASSTALMAAYAEGLGILRAANIGKQTHEIDAETTPLARSRALPVRPQSARHRRGVAARQRDRLVAARSDRERA